MVMHGYIFFAAYAAYQNQCTGQRLFKILNYMSLQR